MTVKQAIEQRVRFIRLPEWEPTAYIELPLLASGGHGPWAIVHDVSGQLEVYIGALMADAESRYEVGHVC